ncbi:MAG: TrmH family RNA methyltransferase [Spirochaetota bacterium]
MITIRKLASLPRKTRLRKIVALLSGLERECLSGGAIDVRYVREMAGLLRDDERLGEPLRTSAARMGRLAPTTESARVCREIDAVRHALRAELGQEPAEWDLIAPDRGTLDESVRHIRDFSVYLEDIRSPYNVGAIFRTAESFGVREIFLSPQTPRADHPRAARSSMGATEVVPWSVCEIDEAVARVAPAPGSTAEVFALETGGRELERAVLPEPGLVVLGSEELGVSPEALSLADRSAGRVSISMAGAKASLNVAVAFGILAHWWWHKKSRPE